MAGNNYMDTTWATLVTDFIQQQISSYSQPNESVLGYFPVVPVKYGDKRFQRTVQDPATIVGIGREFNPDAKKKITHVQNGDMACIYDRLEVPRVDFAGDVQGVNIHVGARNDVFVRTLEKVLIEGASSRVVVYGIDDFPNGTAGTINRPEMAGSVTTAGDWVTIANAREDIAVAVSALISKRFYGPKVLLVPSLIKPFVSELISGAGSSGPEATLGNWIVSALGLPIAYSPFVHEAATTDDFNVFVVDTSKCSLGMTAILMDAEYDSKGHAYYWDWELYFAPMFDPIYDGTEWLKGVVRLDARDWMD
jgi:hypothetical protein